MKKVMINQNQPFDKDLTQIKMLLAASPLGSTTKFAWDNFRFTIEHHHINEWTIVVENIAQKKFVEFESNIETFELAELLNAYLI